MVAASYDTGEVLSAVVWKLKNLEDDLKDNESELLYFLLNDREAGSELLAEYENFLRAYGIVRCTGFFAAEDIGEKTDVLKEAGYSTEEDVFPVMSTTIGELAELELIGKTGGASNVKPLGLITEKEFQRGLLRLLMLQKREIVEDLIYLPFEWFDRRVSCCCMSDKKAGGFLLVHRVRAGCLRVEFLGVTGAGTQMDLLNMIRFAVSRGREEYDPETEVLLPVRDEAAGKLIGYFFPDKKGEACIRAQKEVTRR